MNVISSTMTLQNWAQNVRLTVKISHDLSFIYGDYAAVVGMSASIEDGVFGRLVLFVNTLTVKFH